MREERWLPVVGYEGQYEVSDCGRLRSVDRFVTFRGYGKVAPYKMWRIGGLIKPDVTKTGHRLVGLGGGHGANRIRRYLHVLMLEAFIGPNPGKMEGRHLDGNPSRNVIDNICWGTRTRNVMDRKWHKGISCGTRKTKFRPDDVRDVRFLLAHGCRKSEIAKIYNCNPATVRAIEIGRTHIDVV